MPPCLRPGFPLGSLAIQLFHYSADLPNRFRPTLKAPAALVYAPAAVMLEGYRPGEGRIAWLSAPTHWKGWKVGQLLHSQRRISYCVHAVQSLLAVDR